MKLLILRKQKRRRFIEEGAPGSLDSGHHECAPHHQIAESPPFVAADGDDLGSSANDEAVLRLGAGGEPRTAKSMVAFSESEGEEYVEIGQVRALQADEVRLIRRKFWKRCDFCATVKPPRTHHCSQCNRCVVRMDHHCVWIGNCVGLHNMKPFLLFLLYAILATAVSVSLVLIEIFRCFVFDQGSTSSSSQTGDKGEQVCNLDENSGAPDAMYAISTSITGVGLFFILCLGFLTLAVWFAQVYRIRENLTLIDRMQM